MSPLLCQFWLEESKLVFNGVFEKSERVIMDFDDEWRHLLVLRGNQVTPGGMYTSILK